MSTTISRAVLIISAINTRLMATRSCSRSAESTPRPHAPNSVSEMTTACARMWRCVTKTNNTPSQA